MSSNDERPEQAAPWARSDQAADLRRQAEERMARGKAARSPENVDALSPEESGRLIHELQIHQTELEMLNAESQRTKDELGATREKSERRLRFEILVTDTSARLANLTADRADAEIENVLRQIMEFFQIDRCALLEVLKEKGVCRVTHVVYSEGIQQAPREINLAELFPWSYEKLMQGEVVNISRQDDYPEEALMDRQTHVAIGNKSTLDIPLTVNGQILKVIAIDSTRRFQTWPEEYIARLRLLGEILASTLEHIQDRQQLEEQLRFETLLAEISGRFVDQPADQIDREIADAQRRVCECLGLDLSVLWQWKNETPRILNMTHLYRPLGGPPPPEPMYAHEYFPWCQEQLEANRTIVVSSMEDLPAEAARDQEVWRHFGVKTALTIPLSPTGGPPIGALSFNDMLNERTWPEALIQRLQLVAQMFINALTRKENEKALRESEARLTLATESVGAGLWVMEVATGRVWVSPKNRALFHFAPDEEIRTYEDFLKVIHPDDRERVDGDVQRALFFAENLLCDYRIVLPDGSIRWIVSRGHRLLKWTGEPDRIMGLSLDITERKHTENQLKQSLEEVQQLRDRLQTENMYLREEVKLLFKHSEIVGDSKPMKEVLAQAEQVSATDSTVLIHGETGTGKELLAHAIHQMSSRKDRAIIVVNCASLPPTLIESELFGREKGAYTGSLTKMIGRFELADGSTLFLDEIGELPLELQSKLLRVLEQGQFERLGSTRTIKVNVRLIAATNRDLAKDIIDGRFRKDLYYRLHVFPLCLPPLRERKEDIPLLVWSFVKQFEKSLGKHIDSIPKKNMEALINYYWPGNIRELRNVIEHAMILNSKKILAIETPTGATTEQPGSYVLQDIERKHILEVLERTGWRISGKNGAAEILGLKRTTLQSMMNALGITRSVS